jgi:hypothetical protein
VCSAYVSQTKGLAQPRSYTQIVQYVSKTLPLYEAAFRKLEALKPPSSDAATVKAWLAADGRVATAVRSLGVSAQQRNFPAVTTAASQAQLAGNQARQAAAALGMRVCAQLASGR